MVFYVLSITIKTWFGFKIMFYTLIFPPSLDVDVLQLHVAERVDEGCGET